MGLKFASNARQTYFVATLLDRNFEGWYDFTVFTETDSAIMKTLDFSQFGERIGTRMEGKKAQGEIEAAIRALSYGDVLVFDLRKLSLLGYSFADEAIAIVFQRLVANEYGEKFIIIDCDNRDILDGVERAIEKRELAAIVRKSDGTWHVIGTLKDYLKETLDFIVKKKEIRTPDLVEALGVSLPACNNRVTELSRLKLITRERISNQERGSSYVNKAVV